MASERAGDRLWQHRQLGAPLEQPIGSRLKIAPGTDSLDLEPGSAAAEPGSKSPAVTTAVFVYGYSETGDQWQGHHLRVWQVDWHPDGTALASCGDDGTLRSGM